VRVGARRGARGRLAQVAGVAAPRGDLVTWLALVAAHVDELIQLVRPEAIERAFVGRRRRARLARRGARCAFAVADAPVSRSWIRTGDRRVAVAGSGNAEKTWWCAASRSSWAGCTSPATRPTLAVAICHLRHAAFASRPVPRSIPVALGRRESPANRSGRRIARDRAPRRGRAKSPGSCWSTSGASLRGPVSCRPTRAFPEGSRVALDVVTHVREDAIVLSVSIPRRRRSSTGSAR
jgi:Holliday junction resolvasome RuvABC endonuclease subunit